MFKKLSLFLFLIHFFVVPSWAAEDVNKFENAEQEARYKQLIAEMRCPKCLNANLAGSDAPIAADLKAEVYRQVIDGQSNDEIMGFMVARYGDFINYRPPLNKSTFLLWFGPGILLILGLFIVMRMMRNSQKGASDANLSDEEQQALNKILSSHSDSQ